LLSKYHGITNLYDSRGETNDYKGVEQADMCEIIRSYIYNSKADKGDGKIDPNEFNKINCAGTGSTFEFCPKGRSAQDLRGHLEKLQRQKGLEHPVARWQHHLARQA
jgi:hypothetical protein